MPQVTKQVKRYLEAYQAFVGIDPAELNRDILAWLMELYVAAMDSVDGVGCLPKRFGRVKSHLPECVEWDPLYPNDRGIYGTFARDEVEMSALDALEHEQDYVIPHPETLWG